MEFMMSERPERTELYLQIAKTIALRGTCKRAKCGVVITKNNRIVSTGYNGPLQNHCTCDLTQPCERAIHAERNAIAHAAKYGIALEGTIMYSTTAPCKDCAQMIIQAGIIQVYYLNDYRNREGLQLLAFNGITTTKEEIYYQFFYEPAKDNY